MRRVTSQALPEVYADANTTLVGFIFKEKVLRTAGIASHRVDRTPAIKKRSHYASFIRAVLAAGDNTSMFRDSKWVTPQPTQTSNMTDIKADPASSA